MPGRASIGKSTHGLTSASSLGGSQSGGGSQSLVNSQTASTPKARPAKAAAKTTLLRPIPTAFLPRPIVRKLNAFERAVVSFDPTRTVRKAAKSAAKAVGNALKKIFSGW